MKATSARPAARSTLWTRSFTVLCATMLLGYAHHALFLPTIPLYVEDLGGSASLAGLALLTFSVPSVAVRPFLGGLVDRWSAMGILAIGLVLLAAGGLLFAVPALVVVFVAGIVRGLGWAGINTGGYAMLADAAPPERRGEAAAFYTSCTASAQVVFPALALWLIAGPGGFRGVFVLSAALALTGVVLSTFESPRPRWRRRAAPDEGAAPTAPPGPAARGGVDRGVLLATGLNLCSTLAAPAVTAFLPLYARSVGIDDVKWYFVIAGVTNIAVRPLLGRRSDAVGRRPAIVAGLAVQLVGFAVVVAGTGLALIITGGVLVTVGTALISSATTALAMDLADPTSRGRSMATFSMSFQMGAGLGSVLAGALADLAGYRTMYVGAAVLTLLGLLAVTAGWNRITRVPTTTPPTTH